ncbi:MAG: ABC transporter substrate-binding protein [Myxococcales bacterium]|nr:ABC transporter substrate-binding protein [Myxococcales bacterium]
MRCNARKFRLGAWFVVAATLGCSPGSERPPDAGAGPVEIVFKHGKVVGDPEPVERLLRRFEATHPGVRVREETLPAATDDQHQFYALALEGRSADFDVLAMDVIWVPEFARAGWILPVDDLLPADARAAFFPGPIEAVIFEGHAYAVPWYIDAGVLYYRKDLLDAAGLPPPGTWPELVEIARAIVAKHPGMRGFVWQGKQYEGLVCNAMEFLWSAGGAVIDEGRVVLASARNSVALGFMHDLIGPRGVSPAFVTSMTEEPARRIFGDGRAVFLRNWPYAWTLFERADSPVRGKVGIARLPRFEGGRSASTLGGWQLGVNRFSRHPAEAKALVAFLTSADAEKTLALGLGYNPPRRALYDDPDLLAAQPALARLRDVFETARPRPVTPYYAMASQILQPEFSAALTGIKSPEAALASASKQIAHLLAADRG